MSGEPRTPGAGFVLLERVTAAVLLLVLAALGWVVWAAELAEWVGPAESVQVVALLVLLLTALILVSVVALLHTR